MLTGKQEAVDATLAALDVLPEPFKHFAKILVDICAYAGKLLDVLPEPFKHFAKIISRLKKLGKLFVPLKSSGSTWRKNVNTKHCSSRGNDGV